VDKKQLKIAINYYKKGLTLRQIARFFDISAVGLNYHFKKNQVKTRPSGVLRKSLKIDTKKLEQNLKQELEDKAERGAGKTS
jgi:hypothetical protein